MSTTKVRDINSPNGKMLKAFTHSNGLLSPLGREFWITMSIN